MDAPDGGARLISAGRSRSAYRSIRRYLSFLAIAPEAGLYKGT